MDLDRYDYFLPKKNLALEPAVPRDSSKLFVYNSKTDEFFFDHFYNLDKYLPKDSFLVLNNTKVLPARVAMKKENGGKVIVLFLVNTPTVIPSKAKRREESYIFSMVDRKVNINDKLFFEDGNYITAIGQNENIFDFEYNFSKEKLFILLQKFGNMPIPPYLKKTSLKRDELLEKYQTTFARAPVGARLASAAAPTASLHFTDSVFNRLKKKGIEKYFITLHVGMGTFAPITDKNIKEKKLHNEFFEIDRNTWKQIEINKKKEKNLVAVGTTVVRTLESNARHSDFSSTSPQRGPKSLTQNQMSSLTDSIYDKTNLFIFPPYDFKLVDIMITNFHLPKSSLIMLVEAFLQHKRSKKSLVELYNIAIRNNFRFYSFGDVMVIV